jgi:hypothetical protein
VSHSSLSSGHPGGLTGVFGAGGWTAVPLSALAGVVLALALRMVRESPKLGAALDVVLPSCPPLATRVASFRPAGRRRSPLARVGAQRAPPSTV